MPLKDELDEIINQHYCETIKKFINNLIVKSYGNEENIDKIYLFNNIERKYLNEIIIFGALYSTSFPISKESTLIFNFIDYDNNYPLKQLKILKKEYKINQNILEINFDDLEIPFEDCYYKNIKISFKDNSSIEKANIITPYYNQKNYFICSKEADIGNSSEFIFFKTFPTICINKTKIDIKEKFEENQLFKRVNILNINRDTIKLNNKSLFYYDTLEPSNKIQNMIKERNLYPDNLFLIGKNLDVLSFFSKDMYYPFSYINDKIKIEILGLLKNIDLIDKNASLKYLIENKQKLLDMVLDCTSFLNENLFEKYQYGNIQNYNEYDINIFNKYGKYKLFERIFYNNYNLELNELNFNKYKNIIKSLDLFIKKCENIEKEPLQMAKIYFAGCIVLLNYMESNKDNVCDKIFFELIDYGKDSIYKDVIIII